jgi:hypothetical protein
VRARLSLVEDDWGLPPDEDDDEGEWGEDEPMTGAELRRELDRLVRRERERAGPLPDSATVH